MTEQFRRLPVPDGVVGIRADQGLSKVLGISRSAAAALLDDGKALMDGRELRKSERLVDGAWIDVTLPSAEPAANPCEELVEGMDILYSDDHVIAIHKPVGVAAHPTIGWEGPTVVSGLKAAGFTIATSGPPERQGIVQRLDVGTSGVMVVAASELAYSVLKRAFKERTVHKTYHALVQGHPDPFEGTIDAPIGRHPRAGWRFAVTRDGKPSVTHYSTIEAFREASLLSIHLQTGRTHQIRVHMSSIHHPCVGDPMYGCDPHLAERLGLIRQWLHAVNLEFVHPATGNRMSIDCPYPVDLEHALHVLREEN